MPAAQTIIQDALTLIGQLGVGQTANAAELADGLAALNRLIDSWNSDRTTIYAITNGLFNLVTATQTYTIGSGATFNTTRPIKIEHANLSIVDPGATATGKLKTPLKIVTFAEFAALNPRTRASTTPSTLYYDHAIVTAFGTIYLWPIPTFTTNTPQLELWMWTPLASFSDQTTPITLPVGYELALVYNLAMIQATKYPLGRLADLTKIGTTAASALQNIRTLNLNLFDTAQPDSSSPAPMAVPA